MVTQKRQAILKAAEELFATQGFNQTKVADIAKESQVHEASLYVYFKNKKNILFDIYGDYVRTAVQRLKGHFQGMKESGPKLRKLIGTLDQFILEQFLRKSACLGLVELNAIVDSLVRAVKVRKVV
jgi:AcrR family transcriptional regulator